MKEGEDVGPLKGFQHILPWFFFFFFSIRFLEKVVVSPKCSVCGVVGEQSN